MTTILRAHLDLERWRSLYPWRDLADGATEGQWFYLLGSVAAAIEPSVELKRRWREALERAVS